MKHWILPILFFVICVLVSFQWGYYRGDKAAVTQLKNDSVITVYDSAIVQLPGAIDTQLVAYPVFKKNSLSATDSLAIFKAFFSKSSFSASATANQVEVRAKGFVLQNRLDSIGFSIKNLRPINQVFNSYQPEIKTLSIGALAGSNFAAPIISYQGESWGLLAGYNLIKNDLQPTGFFAGVTFSIYGSR
jgi:hypothetical protein